MPIVAKENTQMLTWAWANRLIITQIDEYRHDKPDRYRLIKYQKAVWYLKNTEKLAHHSIAKEVKFPTPVIH